MGTTSQLLALYTLVFSCIFKETADLKWRKQKDLSVKYISYDLSWVFQPFSHAKQFIYDCCKCWVHHRYSHQCQACEAYLKDYALSSAFNSVLQNVPQFQKDTDQNELV